MIWMGFQKAISWVETITNVYSIEKCMCTAFGISEMTLICVATKDNVKYIQFPCISWGVLPWIMRYVGPWMISLSFKNY